MHRTILSASILSITKIFLARAVPEFDQNVPPAVAASQSPSLAVYKLPTHDNIKCDHYNKPKDGILRTLKLCCFPSYTIDHYCLSCTPPIFPPFLCIHPISTVLYRTVASPLTCFPPKKGPNTSKPSKKTPESDRTR